MDQKKTDVLWIAGSWLCQNDWIHGFWLRQYHYNWIKEKVEPVCGPLCVASSNLSEFADAELINGIQVNQWIWLKWSAKHSSVATLYKSRWPQVAALATKQCSFLFKDRNMCVFVVGGDAILTTSAFQIKGNVS